MAEDGIRPAGEDSSDPSPFLAESVVSDRVDPAMNPMKALTLHEAGQALTPDTDRFKLRPGHHTVLIGRNAGDLSGLGDFLTHVRE